MGDGRRPTMRDVADESTSRQRFNVWLMSLFGASALLLAAIGIYGLMAYSVEQRTRELGLLRALGFDRGQPISLDGRRESGPKILQSLNQRFAEYGVGRSLYTGDTTIGLKGRIVFEAPGLTALATAHRALEEAVLSKAQNRFKPEVGRKWVELVYEGFFHDPLKADLEAFLLSSQARVSGEVLLSTTGGLVHAAAIDSPNLLQSARATYAQSADWGVAEAEGFIRLFGMSSGLWAEVGRRNQVERA